jgi:diguanylate cyclase
MFHGAKRDAKRQAFMAIRRTKTRRRIAGSTYLELLRSLFDSAVSSTIMGALFIITAWACAGSANNPGLTVVAIAGSLVSILRVEILVRLRGRLDSPSLDLRTGRAAERLYGSVYLAFAGILGLFAAMCLQWCAVEYHMVITALIVGYGAGVAAGMSLRPWIAVPAITLGVAPAILSALVLGDTHHQLLALVLGALLLGGIRSMFARYRAAVEMIGMRQLFGSLARQDPLTGIANRFALEESLAAITADGATDGMVLHCFDLDRFKPVNDVHGHVVGDMLLKAVAGRLKRLLRPGDLAVRLGGDEFAILQMNIRHADEAELLARRIVRAIAEPYSLDGRDIEIGASIGSASGREQGANLTTLLGVADAAMYKVKHAGTASRALAG